MIAIPTRDKPSTFQQINIEVARNATDDFNPFHDKNKWQLIHENPFGAPIVLGFQLEALIEYHVRLHRAEHNEHGIIDDNMLRFSNHQFNFTGAVTCGQDITVDIKSSRLNAGDNTTLSNRVAIKADGKLALVGYKRESQKPLFLHDIRHTDLGDLNVACDRALLPGTPILLKRKYMTNSNAKNFQKGSLAEQSEYFDELEDRVH